MHVLCSHTSDREPEKVADSGGNKRMEDRGTQRGKDREGKRWENLSIFGSEPNIILQPLRFIYCAGRVLCFQNVSCDFIRHHKALQPGTRCLQRRGPQAAHPGPSSVYKHTHTHTHTRFVQHWIDMRQRLMRWGCIRTATILQFSTNAELMGGGRKKKTLHYSLGRKTLKTNTPQQVCFTTCTGTSTCYVIRQHMLLFSATSHWGCFTTGGSENKASIITKK